MLNVKLIFNFSFNFLIKNIKIYQDYKYIDISDKKIRERSYKIHKCAQFKRGMFWKRQMDKSCLFFQTFYLLKFSKQIAIVSR